MNNNNYLTNLPTELLEKIYYEKHKIEMSYIHCELLENYDYMLYDIKCMVDYLNNSLGRLCNEKNEFNAKKTILNIYNAMYNEHYISKKHFISSIMDIINSMSGVIYVGMGFYLNYNSKYRWCCDDTISFRQIILENESIIGKSRMLKEDSDEWVKNNVQS